jgi:uncharacterized protein Smg (DUF494 family)
MVPTLHFFYGGRVGNWILFAKTTTSMVEMVMAVLMAIKGDEVDVDDVMMSTMMMTVTMN